MRWWFATISVIASGCMGPSPLSTPARANAAADLHAFLASHAMIVRRPSTISTGALLVEMLTESAAECRIRGAVDQPDAPAPGVVSLFYVDYGPDGDATCAGAPVPSVCASIRDNCRTIDGSIFCDLRMLVRLELASAVEYQNLHAGTALWVVQHDPAVMGAENAVTFQALASFHQRMRSARDLHVVEIPAPLVTARAFAAKHQSKASALVLSTSLLLLIGHEYAHAEQQLCGEHTPSLPPDGAAILAAYRQLACTDDAAQLRELSADIRGLDLALRLASRRWARTSERDYGIPTNILSADIELETVRTLDGAPQVLLEETLLDVQEYEALFETIGTGAWSAIAHEPVPEPEVESYQQLAQYWRDATLAQWSAPTSTLAASGYGKTHMPSSIRALIALAMTNGRVHGLPPPRFRGEPGGRLMGVGSGDAVSMQLRYCRRLSLNEAHEGWMSFQTRVDAAESALPPELQHSLGEAP